MPTDTKLKELIINELTEEQYKALTPNDDELYLTPDGSITKNKNGSYVLNGLEAKANADVTVGKNLEIYGKTQLNGGFANVRIYEFTDNKGTKWILEDYGAISTTWHYHIIGLSDAAGNYLVFGLGFYRISGQGVNVVEVLGPEYYSTAYQEFSYYDGVMTIKTAAYEENTQPKLYTHTITLTADKSYTLIYQSTKDLNVDSIAGLRTIMNVTATSDNVILPVCATDLSGTAVLQVTTALCKIGAANVTAVSDKVTTAA